MDYFTGVLFCNFAFLHYANGMVFCFSFMVYQQLQFIGQIGGVMEYFLQVLFHNLQVMKFCERFLL